MKKFTLVFLVFFSANAFGQSRMIPIISTRLGGLLGGVQNGRYINAKQAAAQLKGAGKFNLFHMSGAAAGSFSAVVEKPDVPCEEFYPIKFAEEVKNGVAIGDGAKWKAVPRAVSSMDTNNASYKKIAADVLRTKGVITNDAQIRQAYRVDLDGDGTEEVLIAASSYPENVSASAKKNDYSFVMMRKIVGGKVRNIILSGDFVRKNIEFGAPSKFEISTLADLNGDGKMEIIIYGAYYEGNWIDVYELKGSRTAQIKALNTGCGV